MEAFDLETIEKRDFLFSLSRSFQKEFNANNSTFRKQLNEKYRKEKYEIERVLASFGGKEDFLGVKEVFKTRKENIEILVKYISKIAEEGHLTVSKLNLLSSYIHMFLNRFIRSKHRLHEMMIYDLLYQHFKSSVAREKGTSISL